MACRACLLLFLGVLWVGAGRKNLAPKVIKVSLSPLFFDIFSKHAVYSAIGRVFGLRESKNFNTFAVTIRAP